MKHQKSNCTGKTDVRESRDRMRAQLRRLTALFKECVADETPHSLVRLTLEMAQAERLLGEDDSQWSIVLPGEVPPCSYTPKGGAMANTFKFSGRSLRLSKAQTLIYENHGVLGAPPGVDACPASDDMRREAKSAARVRANKTGKPVTIYSNDGIPFEQVHPDE